MSKRVSTRKIGIKKTLIGIVPVLKGRQYKMGGNGSVRGNPFDCFGMLVEYCKLRLGIDVLKDHADQGFDFFGYSDLSNDVSSSIFNEYLNKCFLSVVPSYKRSGDILWCETDKGSALGIYLGNGSMLITAPKINCDIISTRYYKIESVYRCPLRFL